MNHVYSNSLKIYGSWLPSVKLFAFSQQGNPLRQGYTLGRSGPHQAKRNAKTTDLLCKLSKYNGIIWIVRLVALTIATNSSTESAAGRFEDGGGQPMRAYSREQLARPTDILQ